jgi:hypothetical protein
VGRVWPRHSGGGRPLNAIVRTHANERGIFFLGLRLALAGMRGSNHRRELEPLLKIIGRVRGFVWRWLGRRLTEAPEIRAGA